MLVLLQAKAVAVVVAEARGGFGIVAHRKKMSSFGIIKSSFEACQRPIVADFSSFRNNIKCILLLFTYSGAAAAAAAAATADAAAAAPLCIASRSNALLLSLCTVGDFPAVSIRLKPHYHH